MDDITQLRVGRTVRVSGAPCSGYPYEHPDRGGATAARAFLDRRQKSMLNYHQGLSVIRNHAQLFSGGAPQDSLEPIKPLPPQGGLDWALFFLAPFEEPFRPTGTLVLVEYVSLRGGGLTQDPDGNSHS